MSAEQVIRVVNEQRKRCQAGILGAAETSPWWRRLSKDEQTLYRAKVLDSVSVFYDLCRDVIKVTESDDIPRNEYALQLLLDLHAKIDHLKG